MSCLRKTYNRTNLNNSGSVLWYIPLPTLLLYIKTWSQIPQYLGPSPWSLRLSGALPPLWLGTSLQVPSSPAAACVHCAWVLSLSKTPNSLGLRNIPDERWMGEGWTAQPATRTSHSKHSCFQWMIETCVESISRLRTRGRRGMWKACRAKRAYSHSRQLSAQPD